MNVLVAGGTGLVGRCLVEELAKDASIETIYVLSRRSVAPMNHKVKILLIDFDDLEEVLNQLEDVEAVYSCLGTTKSQTPDRTLYEKIEIHYPLAMAKWARTQGVSQFHYISSIGTKIDTKNEYLSRKAVTEQELKHAQIPQVFLYRPSLITGERETTRSLELISAKVLQVFKPFLLGKAKKYKPISAKTIAKAMAVMSTKVQPGTFVLESDEIEALGSDASRCRLTY